jgi:hypothetical protein
MNALLQLLPAWREFFPARLARWKRRHWSFEKYEAPRRPGFYGPAPKSHERFEQEARQARRESMML